MLLLSICKEWEMCEGKKSEEHSRDADCIRRTSWRHPLVLVIEGRPATMATGHENDAVLVSKMDDEDGRKGEEWNARCIQIVMSAIDHP